MHIYCIDCRVILVYFPDQLVFSLGSLTSVNNNSKLLIAQVNLDVCFGVVSLTLYYIHKQVPLAVSFKKIQSLTTFHHIHYYHHHHSDLFS